LIPRNSLSKADTAQNEALTKGRGRTLTKAQLVRAVRVDTTYVRGVAAVVFRDNPAVLTEFESTLPRQTVQPRGAGGKGSILVKEEEPSSRSTHLLGP
jgi:hypothetical protein